MNFSDAIIAGSVQIKPNEQAWLKKESDGTYSGCACGMALYAMGVRDEIFLPSHVQALIEKFFPWTAEYERMVPRFGLFGLLGRISLIFARDGVYGVVDLVERLQTEFVPAKEEVCEMQESCL